MKALQITFSSGENITVIPQTESCEVSVNNLSLLISLSEQTGFSLISKAHATTDQFLTVTTTQLVESSEPKQMAEGGQSVGEHGIRRTCIVCGGYSYCISGGCANTPCGWICG